MRCHGRGTRSGIPICSAIQGKRENAVAAETNAPFQSTRAKRAVLVRFFLAADRLIAQHGATSAGDDVTSERIPRGGRQPARRAALTRVEYPPRLQTRLPISVVTRTDHDLPGIRSARLRPTARHRPLRGRFTEIFRDVFGGPTQFALQPGGAISATRRHAHDDHRQPCQTIEPEAGSGEGHVEIPLPPRIRPCGRVGVEAVKQPAGSRPLL